MLISRRRSLSILAAAGVMPMRAVAQDKKETRKPSHYQAKQVLVYRNEKNAVTGRLTVTCTSTLQGTSTKLKDATIKLELVPTLYKFDPTAIQYETIERSEPSKPLERRKMQRTVHGVQSTVEAGVDQGGIVIEIPVKVGANNLYTVEQKTELHAHVRLVDGEGQDAFVDLITVPPQSSLTVNAGQLERVGQGIDNLRDHTLQRFYMTDDRYRRADRYFRAQPTLSDKRLEQTNAMYLTVKTGAGKQLRVAGINMEACRTLYKEIDKLVQTNLRTLRDSKGEPQYSSGCILSTVVVDALGLPDDAWELKVLRGFRDRYMRANGLSEEIGRYYRLSHRILQSARMQSDRLASEVRGLYWSMVLPCAVMSRLGLNRGCYRLYRWQVSRLIRRCRRSM